MADTPKEELQKLQVEFRKLFEAEKEIAEAGLVTADLMAAQVALLPDDGEPSLPVIDIHDALPVRVGEIAKFEVTLSQPSQDLVTVNWSADGAGINQLGVESFDPGAQKAQIEIEASHEGGMISVTLTLPAPMAALATIGRVTATGTVLPATGGEVGPLEPVDGSKPQVAISVGTTPRQTWHGYGWGCGSHNHAAASFPKLQANVRKLCEDMGTTVVRFFTPEKGSAFVTAYKPIWDLVKAHGVDTVFSSSYIHSAAGGVAGAHPDLAAKGIDAAIRAGINPTTFAATMQNEPDSPGGANTTTYSEAIRDQQKVFRDTLNGLGRGAVITLGLEWRHPQTASRLQREYDMHAERGQVGRDRALGGGLLHIYDKSPDQNDYDNRYLKNGLGLWSTETGYMGPNAIARMMSGINNGCSVELAHIGQAARDDESTNDQSQKLIAASGTPRPWYHALRALSRELHRGTVMRLCTSSVAGRMLWKDWTCQHQAICGRRQDGKWLVAANAFNGPAQMTVTIPELSTRNIAMVGQRVSEGGGTSSAKANLRSGVVRFSLAPRETIVLVG